MTGAIATVFLFIVISGGIRRIAKTAELVVPFMTIGFVVLTLIIIVMNIRIVLRRLSDGHASQRLLRFLLYTAFGYPYERVV